MSKSRPISRSRSRSNLGKIKDLLLVSLVFNYFLPLFFQKKKKGMNKLAKPQYNIICFLLLFCGQNNFAGKKNVYVRKAAKKYLFIGQSTKSFSIPPPPPFGLVVKRTAKDLKTKQKYFFLSEHSTPYPSPS